MEIRDVIENMRVEILSLKLRFTSLRSEQDMLERFLWELLSHLANNDQVVITLEDNVSRETETNGEYPDATLF